MLKKCSCIYSNDGRRVGECLRCFEMKTKAVTKAKSELCREILEKLEGLRPIETPSESTKWFDEGLKVAKKIVSEAGGLDHTTKRKRKESIDG